MTMYRVGPAGIPASLKTNMDAVLNKKFGTSTTYAPATWPDNVNLLGPLPEKTASGSVANITDGADGVPIKAWEVTLPASLSGYSAINGTKNTGTGTPETQYTVSLGRTIYGGTADVVNGTGTETYLKIVLDGTQEIGLANWKPTTGTSAWLYAPSITPNLLNNYLTAYNLDNIVCDVLPTVPYNTTAQRIDESTTKGISVVGTNNWGLAVRVEDDTLRTKPDINAWLANNPITVIYKVATPTDFTFDPITPTPETALGVNNFWADEGDSDVTYRADINMLIASLSGNRGLMMTRPQLEEITEENKEESPEVTEK